MTTVTSFERPLPQSNEDLYFALACAVDQMIAVKIPVSKRLFSGLARVLEQNQGWEDSLLARAGAQHQIDGLDPDMSNDDGGRQMLESRLDGIPFSIDHALRTGMYLKQAGHLEPSPMSRKL